jgi:hypothetical protein
MIHASFLRGLSHKVLQSVFEVRIGLGYTDKKEKKIFRIYREIQSGAVTKSYEEGLPNI